MRPLLLLFLVATAPAVLAQAPGPGAVVINEIAYDPPAPQAATNEWIEVVNRSAATVDLAGMTVGDGGTPSAAVVGPLLLPPGGFAVLVRNGTEFAAAYPGVPHQVLAGFPALNNTGDRVAIAIGATEIDAVPYTSSWGGTDASLERIDPDASSTDPGNFGTTTALSGGTPGAQNSIFGQNDDTTPPVLLGAAAIDAQTIQVTFDEPLGPASALTVSNYAIAGVGAPATAVFGATTDIVRLGLAAPLVGPASFTLTVTSIADPSGNILASAQATFFFGTGDAALPRDLVINEFMYDPPGTDNPGEYVELFNRTTKTFDLRSFTLNDGTGADEPITTNPIFVEPGGYVVIVDNPALFDAVFPGVARIDQPAWSALNNTGDAIVLRYLGTMIDSLRFEPSWGGTDAALERKDPDAPSSIAVNWATTSDLRGGTPGAINSRFAPDVTGPQLTAAAASIDGRSVTVSIDEPLDPGSVSAGSFSLSGGPAVTQIEYMPFALSVRLTLSARVPAGETTVSATGLRDLIGNTTATTQTTLTFTPDDTPPRIASALAESATTVHVTFSEAVTLASATAAGTYSVDGGVGAPASVEATFTSGTVRGAVLTLSQPLAERQVFTLTATGLVDLAGNVSGPSTAALFFGAADVPTRGQLVINEIMYDPSAGSDGEYIEVVNTTADKLFDLRGILLGDEGDEGRPLSASVSLVLPGQILTLVRNADAFSAAFPGAAFALSGSVISLSNSGESLVLRAAGAVVDSVTYDPDWHRVELDDATGISLERRDTAGPSSAASNWSSSLSETGGTPSAPNTVTLAANPVQRDGGLSVTSPFAPDDGESAQIVYTLESDAGLVRARLFDGGGRLVRELESGRFGGSTGTLVWDGRGEAGERLRTGIYVVLVESVDAQGGRTEAYRAAIVLARR